MKRLDHSAAATVALSAAAVALLIWSSRDIGSTPPQTLAHYSEAMAYALQDSINNVAKGVVFLLSIVATYFGMKTVALSVREVILCIGRSRRRVPQ